MHSPSTKKRVKSHYHMKGMGTLLSMYGQAGGAIENEYKSNKAEYIKLKEQYENEENPEKRGVMKDKLKTAKTVLEQSKTKMKQLLNGASETAQRAAKALSSSIKSLGSKLKSSSIKARQYIKSKLKKRASPKSPSNVRWKYK